VFDKLPPKARELVRLAWEKDYYEKNREKGFDWWFHAVIDFIAGMTDSYLKKLALNIG
jgi:dGTP triphosphohydrolase